MKWIEALKVWNAEHNAGKWCVAKKGTPEYDQVKAIMERGKEAPKPTGMKPKEMMEHLKAKKAAKAAKTSEKSVKEHIEESDALLAEINELLGAEKKPAASEPKAPSRDRAAEEKMIREIAAAHAKKYGEESEKRKKVMAFLKEAAKKLKEKRAAKEAAASSKILEPLPSDLGRYQMLGGAGKFKKDKQSFETKYAEYFKKNPHMLVDNIKKGRSTAPEKQRAGNPATEARKLSLQHNIAHTEEVKRLYEEKRASRTTTPGQHHSLSKVILGLGLTIRRMKKELESL